MTLYSNDQGSPGSAIPVRLVNAGGSAFVNPGGGGPSGGGSPKGYQQITSMGTAQTLTVPTGATNAVLTIEGTDGRWRDDGVAPTASVGMPIYAGIPTTFSGDLSVLQIIQQNASATLNVSYYG